MTDIQSLKKIVEQYFNTSIEVIDVEKDNFDVEEFDSKPKYILMIPCDNFDQFCKDFWDKESHFYPDIEICTDG